MVKPGSSARGRFELGLALLTKDADLSPATTDIIHACTSCPLENAVCGTRARRRVTLPLAAPDNRQGCADVPVRVAWIGLDDHRAVSADEVFESAVERPNSRARTPS